MSHVARAWKGLSALAVTPTQCKKAFITKQNILVGGFAYWVTKYLYFMSIMVS